MSAPPINNLPPGLLVEGAAVLGEFLAQHGGKAVVYAVTIEVLSAVAIEAIREMRRKKKTCIEHLSDCLMTSTNDKDGNNWNTRRCKTCFDLCRNGNWPTNVNLPDGGSCAY